MLIKDVTVLTADGGSAEHCWVATQGEYISYIGPQQGAPHDTEEVDGRGGLLTAGFVNAHTHVPMTLLRGWGEDLPLQRWLNERIFPFEDQLDGDAVYWGSLLGMAEMIQGGTTSFTDMYYFCDRIVDAAEHCGIKANIGRGLTCFDPQAKLAELPAYRESEQLLQRLQGRARLRADVAPHAEYTTRPDLLEGLAALAERYGARMHIHLSETESEHRECIARHGVTPAGLLEKTGVLSRPVTVAHGVWLSEQDVELLAARDVTLAHCPKSNAKLGSGIAPVARYLQKGLKVALGTDSAASNNALRMVEEMRFAALLAKASACDPCALPAADALHMATRAGALSQGRTDCGILAVGARADLVLFDTERPCMQPQHDALANLLYAAGQHCVRMTVVDGKVLYRDGEFTTLDIERVCFEAARCTEKIVQKLQKR